MLSNQTAPNGKPYGLPLRKIQIFSRAREQTDANLTIYANPWRVGVSSISFGSVESSRAITPDATSSSQYS